RRVPGEVGRIPRFLTLLGAEARTSGGIPVPARPSGTEARKPAAASGAPDQALRTRIGLAVPELSPVLGERDQALHPPVPLAAPLLGNDAGRRAAHRELLAHPLEVHPLVTPGAVEGLLPAEPLLGDGVELAGELDHLDALEAREQRFAVDFAPELEALLEA